MPEPTTVRGPATPDLDVRDVPKPQRHPLIFARFAELSAAESFVLVNNHDPRHLRQEFDRDHRGSYEWTYLESGPVWRIRITRLIETDLPRVLCNVQDLTSDDASTDDAAGAIWALDISQRHLDANVIHLQPHSGIEMHAGPHLDVLVYILTGSGLLTTETGTVALGSGMLVWLPRRSQRSFTAAATGLSYITVHPRRPALTIGNASTR
jgi:uncharacterized protein (DUF2249 family)/quercetin dioxygenase-like cupin family protein